MTRCLDNGRGGYSSITRADFLVVEKKEFNPTLLPRLVLKIPDCASLQLRFASSTFKRRRHGFSPLPLASSRTTEPGSPLAYIKISSNNQRHRELFGFLEGVLENLQPREDINFDFDYIHGKDCQLLLSWATPEEMQLDESSRWGRIHHGFKENWTNQPHEPDIAASQFPVASAIEAKFSPQIPIARFSSCLCGERNHISTIALIFYLKPIRHFPHPSGKYWFRFEGETLFYGRYVGKRS